MKTSYIRVREGCPYLDMENLTCTRDDSDQALRTPECLGCRVALYELWKKKHGG